MRYKATELKDGIMELVAVDRPAYSKMPETITLDIGDVLPKAVTSMPAAPASEETESKKGPKKK